MRKLTIASLLVVGASAAFADGPIYWDNGTFTTGVGNGFGGANTSEINGGGTVFGFGAQIGANNQVADDFVVGAGGAMISGVKVYMYQTGMTTGATTFTGLKFAIFAGAPLVLTTETPVVTTDTWTGVYRVTAATLTNNQRPIWELEYKFNPIFMDAGTYWLSWQASGSLASGPWQVPTAAIGGNGMQSIGGGAFAALADPAGTGRELAFKIQGEAVPEPGTFLAIGAGVAALAIARRRRK